MAEKTEKNVATVEAQTTTVNVIQKEKGKDNIRFKAQVTDAPVSYSDLLIMAEDDLALQSAIMIAVNDSARARTLGRLTALDNKGEELFQTVDFHTVMTTAQQSLTPAKMVELKTMRLGEVANQIDVAIDNDDFEQAKELKDVRDKLKVELQYWEDEREKARLKKVEGRNNS